MTPHGPTEESVGRQVDDLLSRAFADGTVARKERRALKELLESASLPPSAWPRVVESVIRVAKGRDPGHHSATLDALGEVFLAVLSGLNPAATAGGIAGVTFSPGPACRDRILSILKDAQRSADICVFTITDDKVTSALRAAHGRGVAVRVISDDDKARDPGSDLLTLHDDGVDVVLDGSPESMMHNKFAVVDGWILLTGSYNWTTGAHRDNHENLVVTTEPRLVDPFKQRFEKLWTELGPPLGRRRAKRLRQTRRHVL